MKNKTLTDASNVFPRVTRNVDRGTERSATRLSTPRTRSHGIARDVDGKPDAEQQDPRLLQRLPGVTRDVDGNQILSNKTLDSFTLTSANTFPGLRGSSLPGTGPTPGTTFFGTAGSARCRKRLFRRWFLG